MKCMRVAIVVCTFNRASSLEKTLSALLAQVSSNVLEIVVVDNNSTDETSAVVQRLSAGAPLPVRRLFEPVQGLSHARNRAIAETSADVVIFIDDDASPLDERWADRMAAGFSAPDVGAVGGDAVAQWPAGGRPPWLHDALLPYLGITRFGLDRQTDLRYPNFPYGVNIAFRRNLIAGLGGFSTGLGRFGGRLLSGEEIELCRRVAAEGFRVLYLPGVAVRHRMDPKRLERAWFLRRAQAQGISKATIEWPQAGAGTRARLLLKRVAIVALSAAAWGVASLAGQSGPALVARCKLVMSLAYLRTARPLVRGEVALGRQP